MINGHGGNIFRMARNLGCRPDEITDMSSNMNPLGPPEGLVEFLKESLSDITVLPEVDAGEMCSAIARRHRINPDRIIPGNGTTHLIHMLPKALEMKRACILGPAYSDYADACRMWDVEVKWCLTSSERRFVPDLDCLETQMQDCDTVFICNPGNPCGTYIPPSVLKEFCRQWPDKRFIIDEAYFPFVVNANLYDRMLHSGLPNVIVLSSMSKIYRIPGLRIGFLYADEDSHYKMKKYEMPWSVNALAQAAVRFLMTNSSKLDEFIQKTALFISEERDRFCREMDLLPQIELYPGETSYILAELSGGYKAGELKKELMKQRILIRDCSNFTGLSESFIRISLNSSEDNRRTALEIKRLLTT